jgi:alpha-1,2-mannosyltransferase
VNDASNARSTLPHPVLTSAHGDDLVARDPVDRDPVTMQSLRTGAFLSGRWLRLCPFLMLALFILNILVHRQDAAAPTIPFGSDFSEVWAAGVFVLEGKPEKPFDPTSHFDKQRQLFGEHTALFGWCYPPFFLAIAALLAMLPYLIALVLFQVTTGALYLFTMTAILRRRGFVLAVALFPGVLVNAVHGQNGFLSAALIGSALWLLDRRAIAAGLLFGLMAYKPQFGLMIPLALAAGGHWRTIFAAAATLVVMILATLAAFGPDTWFAFKDSLEWTRTVVLEQGSTGFYKLESVFAAARLYGAPVPLAYTVQGLVTLFVGAFVFVLWRSHADIRLKSAALIVATLLTTPYCLDYDLVVLGPAIALAFAYGSERGFKSYEKSVLALCWFMPLVSRLASFYLNFPIGVLSMLLFFALLVRRASDDGCRLWLLPARQTPLAAILDHPDGVVA